MRRINGDMPDGPLLLTVEAYSAPEGEFADPLQLRVRAAGSGDPPRTVPTPQPPLNLRGGVTVIKCRVN